MSSWAGGEAYAGVDYSTGVQNGYGSGDGYQYSTTTDGYSQQGNTQQPSTYMVNQGPAQPQQAQPQAQYQVQPQQAQYQRQAQPQVQRPVQVQYYPNNGGQANTAPVYNNQYPPAQPAQQRTVTQRHAQPAAARVTARTHAPTTQRQRPARPVAGRLSRAFGPAMW